MSSPPIQSLQTTLFLFMSLHRASPFQPLIVQPTHASNSPAASRRLLLGCARRSIILSLADRELGEPGAVEKRLIGCMNDQAMTKYVALLRAVNLAGTGNLPMSELKSMCDSSGFLNARTYINSGNVVFESKLSEAAVKAKLEKCMASYAGKPVDVLVRTGPEMAAVLAKNPFKSQPPNQTVAIFLDERPPKDSLKTITGQAKEEVSLGTREIYAYYPDGMGRSKLKIPAAKRGTARNINTIAKLADWASG